MVSSGLPIVVCVLCVSLLSSVWANSCDSYRDTSGKSHGSQMCLLNFCCGTCTKRYCCSDRRYKLTEIMQQRCPQRPAYGGKSNLSVILGSVFGSVVPVIVCVCLVICCVAPCCLCYKKCRKRGNQNNQGMGTVVTTPQQPVSPSGYHPSYPGYQPVPVQPGHGGPYNPAAPPPYNPAALPPYNPAAPPPYIGPIGPMQPSYPYPGQTYAPPPQSDDLSQPPYNPAYDPNS